MHANAKCTKVGFGWALAAAMSLAGCAMPASQAPAPAPAAAAKAATTGTMTGKVVWVDIKNSALLVVCEDTPGCKDVSGKAGETYTLIIPPAMKKDAAAWKEGGVVKVTFEDRDDGGRALKSINTGP